MRQKIDFELPDGKGLTHMSNAFQQSIRFSITRHQNDRRRHLRRVACDKFDARRVDVYASEDLSI